MANRNFNTMQALTRQLKVIGGRVDFESGSIVGVEGRGFTATSGADGTEIRVNLDDNYNALLFASALVEGAAHGIHLLSADVQSVAAPHVILKAANEITGSTFHGAVHVGLHLRNSSQE